MPLIGKHKKVLSTEQQALVLSCTALVYSLAWSFKKDKPKNILTEDLVGAGMIGLCEAATRFDPTKGVKFSTFAYRRIVGAIQDELRHTLGRGGVGYEVGCAALTDYINDKPFELGDSGAISSLCEDEITVRQILSRIPPRDAVLIDQFFHADRDKDMAKSMGVSKAWASKVKKRLIDKMQRVA